jgi:hypothetical protein
MNWKNLSDAEPEVLTTLRIYVVVVLFMHRVWLWYTTVLEADIPSTFRVK